MKMKMKTLALGVLAATVTVFSANAAVVVNEFDYDNINTDNAEFVELYNPDATAQSLSGLSLVFFNGVNSTNSAYATIALTGSIPAGGYYSIGNATGVTQLVTPASDLIQNGPPDSFGIYTGTAPTAATANNLVAGTGITYEGTNTGIPTTFTVVGASGADGDSNTLQASFQRVPNGTGAFVLSATPTLNAANVLVALPEPSSLALLGLGGLAMVRRRRA